MGYCSDVSIAISNNVLKDVNRLEILGEKPFPEMLRECENISVHEDCTTYGWTYIKWYDTYDDVTELTNYLISLNEDDYQFLRIGEDPSDTEDLGNLSIFYVSRTIEAC